MPLIKKIANNMILQSQLPLFNNIIEQNHLLPVQISKIPLTNIFNCKTGKYNINPNLDIQNLQYNNELVKLSSHFNINKIKDVLTQNQFKVLQNSIIVETKLIENNKYLPHFRYTILIVFMVLLLITIYNISKYYNIKINYKFTIINSIIVFLIICLYASLFLWYSVFSQPYVININKNLAKTFLDVFNSA